MNKSIKILALSALALFTSVTQAFEGSVVDLPEKDYEAVGRSLSYFQCARVFNEGKEYRAAAIFENAAEKEFDSIAEAYGLNKATDLMLEQRDRYYGELGFTNESVSIWCYRLAYKSGILKTI